MKFKRAWHSVLLIGLFLSMGLTLAPQPANAAAFGLVPCALRSDNPATAGWDERDPCTLCHLLIGIKNIIDFFRNIMTGIAVAVIVAMAIVYITSAGNESQMEFAKGGIKASLIGFAIILSAWIIVNFIYTLPGMYNTGIVRSGWDQFTCNVKSKVQSTTPAGATGNPAGSSGSNGSGSAGGNSGASAPCASGVYVWRVNNITCTASYAAMSHNDRLAVTDTSLPTSGTARIMCQNGTIVADTSAGEATCVL